MMLKKLSNRNDVKKAFQLVLMTMIHAMHLKNITLPTDEFRKEKDLRRTIY